MNEQRKLDEQCAIALGLEIIHTAWPCGYAPDCGTYEAAINETDQPGLSRIAPDIVYKIHEPLEEWKDELGLWCAPLPSYSADHATARLLEDEIDKRGLQSHYLHWFYKWVCQPEMNTNEETWAIIRATPLQKAKAFVYAMQRERA